MDVKVAAYNIEWMVNLFTQDGQPEMSGSDGKRSSMLAEVVKKIDPDILVSLRGLIQLRVVVRAPWIN